MLAAVSYRYDNDGKTATPAGGNFGHAQGKKLPISLNNETMPAEAGMAAPHNLLYEGNTDRGAELFLVFWQSKRHEAGAAGYCWAVESMGLIPE